MGSDLHQDPLAKMKTFVLGDIHGGYQALLQCFDLSGFDRGRDHLIFLGDAVDGWSQAPEAIEELRRVKHLTYILGNHDIWFMEWVAMGIKTRDWVMQGGQATIDAYSRPAWLDKRREHLEFLKGASYYHLDGQNRLFVHGGVRGGQPLDEQDTQMMVWDRELYYSVDGLEGFKEVYIGHTPTLTSDSWEPLNFGRPDNVWRMDTGAGWWGCLSLMELESHDVWQSEVVADLYPREKGRV